MSDGIRAEIARLWDLARCGGPSSDQHFAAQQALSWALDPETFIDPITYIRGIPASPTDCREGRHQDRSEETAAPKLDAA
jgi:hypothetical protein